MTPTPEPPALLTMSHWLWDAFARDRGGDAEPFMAEVEAQAAEVTRLQAVIDGHRAWLQLQIDLPDDPDRRLMRCYALADLDQRLAPPKETP